MAVTISSGRETLNHQFSMTALKEHCAEQKYNLSMHVPDCTSVALLLRDYIFGGSSFFLSVLIVIDSKGYSPGVLMLEAKD